jgi:hypothetical protein
MMKALHHGKPEPPHSFQTGENKMSVLEEAAALSKGIIDLINRDTSTRAALVGLADAAGLVIKQRFEPKHHDETVEYLASLVKSRISAPDEMALVRLWQHKRGDQSEKND